MRRSKNTGSAEPCTEHLSAWTGFEGNTPNRMAQSMHAGGVQSVAAPGGMVSAHMVQGVAMQGMHAQQQGAASGLGGMDVDPHAAKSVTFKSPEGPMQPGQGHMMPGPVSGSGEVTGEGFMPGHGNTTRYGGTGTPHPGFLSPTTEGRARVLQTFPFLPAFVIMSERAVARISRLIEARSSKDPEVGKEDNPPVAHVRCIHLPIPFLVCALQTRAEAESALHQLSQLHSGIQGVLNAGEEYLWEGAAVRGRDILDRLCNPDMR